MVHLSLAPNYRLEPTKIEGTVPRYVFPVLSPPSAQEYITRQSSSKSISLRMTGKMTGKCRTAVNFAKSFQLPASGTGIHTVPSILVGSSLARVRSRVYSNNAGSIVYYGIIVMYCSLYE